MKSYFARYRSTNGQCLVGAVMKGQSSRFDSRTDAEQRLADTIEINGSHCTGEIVESDKYPEIFRHCPGHPAQAIGGRCFGCGKILTVADAKSHGS
jgi:hypothetical protein